jgi:mitochondrial fission protein ELM1
MTRIVILSAGRQGDLTQMQDVARATGLAFETRYLAFREGPNWRRSFNPEAYLKNKDDPALHALGPSDIVLCAEAQVCAIVAKRKQAGDKFKAVCIGRPRGYFEAFDLIISSPHYLLNGLKNVLELPYPPHLPVKAANDISKTAEEKSLHLCLVGGTSMPDIFDDATIAALVAKLKNISISSRWRVEVLLSPRTTARTAERICNETKNTDIRVWPFEPEAPSVFADRVASASAFTVTSDSVSMTIEAMLTGKPVHVHVLSQHKSFAQIAVRWLWRHQWARAAFSRGILEVRPERLELFERLEQQGLLTTQESVQLKLTGIAPPPTTIDAARALLQLS